MKKPTTVRELLDVIDQFLIDYQMTQTGADAWAILLALRPTQPHPDWEKGVDRNVASVRTAAFPRAAFNGQPIANLPGLVRFSNTVFAAPPGEFHANPAIDPSFLVRADEAIQRMITRALRDAAA